MSTDTDLKTEELTLTANLMNTLEIASNLVHYYINLIHSDYSLVSWQFFIFSAKLTLSAFSIGTSPAL